MAKQVIFIILLITFLEIFGQNAKYLHMVHINSTNIDKVGIISEFSTSKSNENHILRNTSIQHFVKERKHLLELGISWDRFLDMSMTKGPKKSLLSSVTSNETTSKNQSSKELTVKPISRNPQPKTKGPMVSKSTKYPMTQTPTLYPINKISIKSFIPSPSPTSKTRVPPTKRPSTGYPTLLPTSQLIVPPTNRPSKSSSTFNTATESKCNMGPEEIKVAIKILLKQFPFSVDRKSLPINKALKWLINEDGACIDHKTLSQRYILALLYFATSGNGWSRCNQKDKQCGSKSFLSSKSECDWFGVRCNQDGLVKAIYFDDNNLVGTIPSEVGYLNSLETLTLTTGHIASTIPKTIGNLKNLRILHLCENKLAGSIPMEMYNLTQLEALQLSYNQIEGTLDSDIGSLTNLRVLQLQNNQFSKRIPRELKDLTYLEILELQENELVGNIPSRLCSLLSSSGGGGLSTLIADCAGDVPGVSCECCTSCFS